jgi:transcriptional regulator with XRE-family HTH domain
MSRARALRRSAGEQVRDLREERGLSLRELGAAIGVHPSVIARAETGEGNVTLATLARVATALGAEASLRLYPATGPRLLDHLQVRLIETLLERLHARWRARLEVTVYRPVRGVIDLVLASAYDLQLAGGEAHSEIRRAERQLRWAAEKTDALPSADGWPWMSGSPRTSRILLLRSTGSTRAIVRAAPTCSRPPIRAGLLQPSTPWSTATAWFRTGQSCGSISAVPRAGSWMGRRAASTSAGDRIDSAPSGQGEIPDRW